MHKNGLSTNQNKNTFLNSLASAGLDKSKLQILFDSSWDFPEDIFNLGFIIISFKEEFKYYPNKFIPGYDALNATHLKPWNGICKFINLELSPVHFTLGLNGSRNIVYKISFPEELNISIAIRKRLSQIEKFRILQKEPKFKLSNIPQNDYKWQMEVQEKLYLMDNIPFKLGIKYIQLRLIEI